MLFIRKLCDFLNNPFVILGKDKNCVVCGPLAKVISVEQDQSLNTHPLTISRNWSRERKNEKPELDNRKSKTHIALGLPDNDYVLLLTLLFRSERNTKVIQNEPFGRRDEPTGDESDGFDIRLGCDVMTDRQ